MSLRQAANSKMCLWPAAVLGNHSEPAASAPRLTFLSLGSFQREPREELQCLLSAKPTHEPQNSSGLSGRAGGSGGPSAMRTTTTTTSGGRLQFKTGLARLRKGHWPSWDGTRLFLYLNCKNNVFFLPVFRIFFQNKVLLGWIRVRRLYLLHLSDIFPYLRKCGSSSHPW